MLSRAPDPAVRGDARALPFPHASFASVALLYVLYHLADPVRTLEEASRVLRTGGLVAVAAPSRDDSPELAHALPDSPLTFDAELAPGMVGGLFTEVEVERWDAPLLELPDREAVRGYLIGKGLSRGEARLAADSVATPLQVTKRGSLLFARKR
jgi:SAM-dependent methyltransferase